MPHPHPASRVPRYDQLGPDPEPPGVRAEFLLGEAVEPSPTIRSVRPPFARVPRARRRSPSAGYHAR